MEFENFQTALPEPQCTKDISVKEEELEEATLNIKIEEEVDKYESENSGDEDYPLENLRLKVKQEIIMNIEKNNADSLSSDVFPIRLRSLDTISQGSSELIDMIVPERTELDVKEETITGDQFVPYEYPNYDDSMDSNEAVALTKVEACLQEDLNIKTEDLENNTKEDIYKVIKDEADLTVTETHLISNKVINTTSTITNAINGFIESQTTKTLVMEIRPMIEGNVHLKISNPEKILPTNDMYMDYDKTFQLNSITGNVLSLEQEAYGLLTRKSKKILNNKNIPCPKCTNTYSSKYHLKRHLMVHDTIDKRALGIIKGQKTREENRKKKLNTKSKVEDERTRMEILKKEGYICMCGNVFRRRSRMETCLKSHNLYTDTNSYQCLTCSRQFQSKEELVVHRKRVHRKRFACKFCPTDYNTRKELFKHLRAHQKVQLMEYKFISEVVKGKQKLKCFMCSKTYSELSDLKSHVMDDHKEPYTCPHCKQTFPKIIDFGNHTKTYHPEVEGQSVLDVLEAFSELVKAWKCEECGQQFHEADKLALHQISSHSPEIKADPQLQCPDCRRVFVSQKGLTSHKRIHHSIETVEESKPVEQGIMCLECRKMCKDMTALTSHMRLHSPDRKFPCKFCDFRFATPEKRKIHSELHTGDMKYVCFICEYQCSSENRLKQHKMSLKHLNMKEFLLTGVPLVEEESTSQQNKVKETLKKEERGVKKRKRERDRSSSVSPEPVEVACDICGDKFPSESEMLEHKQTHPFIEFPNEDTPSRIFFK